MFSATATLARSSAEAPILSTRLSPRTTSRSPRATSRYTHTTATAAREYTATSAPIAHLTCIITKKSWVTTLSSELSFWMTERTSSLELKSLERIDSNGRRRLLRHLTLCLLHLPKRSRVCKNVHSGRSIVALDLFLSELTSLDSLLSWSRYEI